MGLAPTTEFSRATHCTFEEPVLDDGYAGDETLVDRRHMPLKERDIEVRQSDWQSHAMLSYIK